MVAGVEAAGRTWRWTGFGMLGPLSRFAVLTSDAAAAFAPDPDSLLWWPARAMLGDGEALLCLLAAGLVTRRDNPANRREVQLRLTDEGAHLVRTVTTRRRARIARIVTAMPDADRTGLIQALTAFGDAAGEPTASSATLGW